MFTSWLFISLLFFIIDPLTFWFPSLSYLITQNYPKKSVWGILQFFFFYKERYHSKEHQIEVYNLSWLLNQLNGIMAITDKNKMSYVMKILCLSTSHFFLIVFFTKSVIFDSITQAMVFKYLSTSQNNVL